VSATDEDLMAFGAACRTLAEAAEALLATLAPDEREGAEIVRQNASRLAREAESGALAGRPRVGALPLSRPFGEWDYRGPEAEAVWDAMGAVDGIWLDRLDSGAALAGLRAQPGGS
jgi:hypothetical protein